MLAVDIPPSFIGGVSQQDETHREPTQCSAQENWWCSPVDQATPRHPLEHKARLFGSASLIKNKGPLSVHVSDRGAGDRYTIALGERQAYVIDADTGEQLPVISPNVGTLVLPTGNLPSNGSVLTIDPGPTAALTARTFTFHSAPTAADADPAYFVNTAIYNTVDLAMKRLAVLIRSVSGWAVDAFYSNGILTIYDGEPVNYNAAIAFLAKSGGDSATSMRIEWSTLTNLSYLHALSDAGITLITPEDLVDNMAAVQESPASGAPTTTPWKSNGTAGTSYFGTGVTARGPFGPARYQQLRTNGTNVQDGMYFYRFVKSGEPTQFNTFAPDKTIQIVGALILNDTTAPSTTFGIGFYNSTTSTWYRANFTFTGATLNMTPTLTGNVSGGAQDLGYGWYWVWCAYRTASPTESTQQRRAGFYQTLTSGATDQRVNVTSVTLEHVASGLIPSSFYVPAQKAFRADFVGDTGIILNTRKIARMDESKLSTEAQKYKLTTITLTSGAGITTDNEVAVDLHAAPDITDKRFVFKPNGFGGADADPVWFITQDATPTAAEAATLLAADLNTMIAAFAPGLAVATASSNVVTVAHPTAWTWTDPVDVGDQIALSTTITTKDEAYIWIKTVNYFQLFGVKLQQGTAKLKAAVGAGRDTSNTADTNSLARCAMFNPGSGAATTSGTCEQTGGVDDPDKGVWFPAAANILSEDVNADTIAQALAFKNVGAIGLATQYRQGILPRFQAAPFVYGTLNTVEATGPVIRLTTPGPIDKIDLFSDDGAMGLVHERVASPTDLPPRAQDGFVIRVDGDNDSELDDYFAIATADKAGTFGEVKWSETVAKDTRVRFDASTMPHRLIQKEDTTGLKTGIIGKRYFEMNRILWTERAAGNDTLSPPPSFIGSRITDTEFFGGRLHMISESRCLGSQVNVFFNFWRTTVRRLDDDDTYDIDISHSTVPVLRDLRAVSGRLLARSDFTVFEIEGQNGVITPKNVHARPIAELPSDSTIQAAISNESLFLAAVSGNGSYGQVLEMFPSEEGSRIMAIDATKQVPAYLTGRVLQLSASARASCAVALTESDRDSLYFYRTDTQGNQRIQQAWFRYNFGSGALVHGSAWCQERLFIWFHRDEELVIEQMVVGERIKDPGTQWLCHMDRRVDGNTSGVSRSYDAGTNSTTIVLPYKLATGETPLVCNKLTGVQYPVLVTGSTSVFLNNPVVENPTGGLSVESATVSILGLQTNLTATELWIGTQFEASMELSQSQLTDQKGQILTGSQIVSDAFVRYSEAMGFTVEVTNKQRTPRTKTFTAGALSSATIGTVTASSPANDRGSFQVPVKGQADETVITLKNVTYKDCRLHKIEATLNYVPEARKV